MLHGHWIVMMIGKHQSLFHLLYQEVGLLTLSYGTKQNITLTTIQVGKQLNPMMTQKLQQSMIGMAQLGHRKIKWLDQMAE